MTENYPYKMLHFGLYLQQKMKEKGINLRDYFKDQEEYLCFAFDLHNRVILDLTPEAEMATLAINEKIKLILN